jgi:hypothetical protein
MISIKNLLLFYASLPIALQSGQCLRLNNGKQGNRAWQRAVASVNRTGSGVRHSAFCLLLALLASCGGGGDINIRSERPLDLLSLLPASTRGVFQVTGLAEGVDPGAVLPAAEQPWRHHPADILRHYATGLDIESNGERLLLAQPAFSGDEFALLVNLRDGGKPPRDLVQAGSYRGVALYQAGAEGLLLALLNSRTLAIAPRGTLETVIDVRRGDVPGIGDSAIANHLEPLESGQPFSFVYGLPALYGEVEPPGSGAASLARATVVSGAFSDDGDTPVGSFQLFTPNAVPFTERLLGVLPETAPDAITATEDRVSVDLAALTLPGDLLPLVKALYPGMDGVDYAEAVGAAGNPPWLNFIVRDQPNSVFINFEFSGAAEREAFAAEHLPAGFTLAPMRILQGEEPRYYLLLNLYQSTGGLVEGARAEWSVMVADPVTGQPRFLVVQAAAASISADPVRLFTLPEPVSHLLETATIDSYVGVVDETSGEERTWFASSIHWPPEPGNTVLFDREFVVANDYIFWGNAVADRGLYNASVHNRPAALVEAGDVSLEDNSNWGQYVDAQPVHTLVYPGPLEIVISPWWNLDADYLDVTTAHLQALLAFKNQFYPLTVIGMAEQALRGGMPLPEPLRVGESAATSYYHFLLTDPAGLFAALDHDQPRTPAAIPLAEGEPAEYYLTLAIHRRENDACGLRADWLTYALDDAGLPYGLQLDGVSSDACLDPVSLLGLSAAVEQAAEDSRLSHRVTTPFVRFAATVETAGATSALPALDWVSAQDSNCSLNDVCSHFFYDGQTLAQPLLTIAGNRVTIEEKSTPWDAFISTGPVRVTVRPAAAVQAVHPWRNVPAFGQ